MGHEFSFWIPNEIPLATSSLVRGSKSTAINGPCLDIFGTNGGWKYKNMVLIFKKLITLWLKYYLFYAFKIKSWICIKKDGKNILLIWKKLLPQSHTYWGVEFDRKYMTYLKKVNFLSILITLNGK